MNQKSSLREVPQFVSRALTGNSQSPERNYTALARPGERVRLRFINASTTTYFDVRIPGLKMTVVQADGNNVAPVRVDEFRIAVAETYDVIVQPTEDRAYTIVGEPMDRTGFARATLAPRPGMVGELPPHRLRPLMQMSDMAMNPGPKGGDRGTLRPEQDMPGHVAPEDPVAMAIGGMGDMSGMSGAGPQRGAQPGGGMPERMSMPKTSPARKGQGEKAKTGKPPQASPMPGMEHGGMPGMNSRNQMVMPKEKRAVDHGAMSGMAPKSPPVHQSRTAMTITDGVQQGAQAHVLDGGEDMPNVGPSIHQTMPDPIANDTGAPPGTRVLSYRDLRPLNPYPYKQYDRIIEIRLTGNMQRYFWSINGRKFSEAEPIVLRFGERARFRFINETMMNHPMHIHGTWMLPEVGNGARNPKKHTVNIKPGTMLDVDIPADAEGPWAFHCHLLYHMETGMMRQVNVVRQTASLK